MASKAASRKIAAHNTARAASQRVEIEAAAGALSDLGLAAGAVLNAVGAWRQPRHVREALGLNQTLAWRLHRIARGATPLEVLEFAPGAAGFGRFFEAAQERGAGGGIVSSAREAFARFQGVVEAHGGDRGALKLLLSGAPALDSSAARADGNAGAADVQLRRAGFRCARATWGVQMRRKFLCQIIGPSAASPERLDFVVVRGSIGMRRLRAGGWLPIAPLSLLDGSGEPVGRPAIEPLMPKQVRNGLAVLREFSTLDPAAVEVGKGPTGVPEYQVAAGVDAPVGEDGGTTVFSGEVYRGAGLRYRDERNTPGSTALTVRVPMESAVIDVWAHRDLFTRAPIALLYGELSGVPWDEQDRAHAEVLPLAERVLTVGSGLASATLAEFPRYRDLVRQACGAVGWSPEDFILHRLSVDYPVVATCLVMRFEMPSRPE